MAPLILHNVPDEELYIGDDGVKRPYAMVFPPQEMQSGSRPRRHIPESGSFGKSVRRSRSRTGTPAKREDPTIRAADKVFSKWKNLYEEEGEGEGGQPGATRSIATPQRRSISRQQHSVDEPAKLTTPSSRSAAQNGPTEVILRGYRSAAQQYAVIHQYELLAGRICEDYSREAPAENRRYKSELRDAAITRKVPLTLEERTKVNRAHGGEHWVKVTFESAQAADAAIFASPQTILGHLVYAEPYNGIPPRDEALPDAVTVGGDFFAAAIRGSDGSLRHRGGRSDGPLRAEDADFGLINSSPPHSQTSSRTLDTATFNDTASSATLTGTAVVPRSASAPVLPTTAPPPADDDDFSQRIAGARKAKVLSADLALLPRAPFAQRVVVAIPMLKWFTGSMIGNQVPRTEAGEFDWDRASLYWKVIWWLDSAFGLFGGEILNADKDD